nr:MAG TPA: hypothetical protein [Caudoviricetes sp.]
MFGIFQDLFGGQGSGKKDDNRRCGNSDRAAVIGSGKSKRKRGKRTGRTRRKRTITDPEHGGNKIRKLFIHADFPDKLSSWERYMKNFFHSIKKICCHIFFLW